MSVIPGKSHCPAAGVEGWKNQEQARQVEVTDDLFAAIYAQADRLLRDSMDISTATGLRVTDVRTIRLPVEGVLRFKPSKTGKWAEFDVKDLPRLTALFGTPAFNESTQRHAAHNRHRPPSI